jgi:hypothetical protein
MRKEGQRRGRRTKATLTVQLVALLCGSLAWTPSASAATHEGLKAYLEAAGMLNVGLYGLASGVRPGAHVGTGIRIPWISGGLAASYATIHPDPDKYGYKTYCSSSPQYPCTNPELSGTYVSVDALARFHPIGLGPIEPYIEGAIGWNTVSLSDPHFELIGQTNFSMQGLHVGAALGIHYELTGFLAAIGSMGYGWSLVEQPESVLSGGGVFTDLVFIDSNAHQFQIGLGLQVHL